MLSLNPKQLIAVLLLSFASAGAMAAEHVYTFYLPVPGVAPSGVAAAPLPTDGSVCADGKPGCAIWSSTDKSVNILVTNGLVASTTGACAPGCPSQYGATHASIGKSSGAYYWEVQSGQKSNGWYMYPCGISPLGGTPNRVSGYDQPGGYGFPDTAPVSNAVHSCLLNLSTNTFSWKRNGVLMGSVDIAPGTYFPSVSAYATDVYTANFGQQAFQYAVPAGYTAGVR